MLDKEGMRQNMALDYNLGLLLSWFSFLRKSKGHIGSKPQGTFILLRLVCSCLAELRSPHGACTIQPLIGIHRCPTETPFSRAREQIMIVASYIEGCGCVSFYCQNLETHNSHSAFRLWNSQWRLWLLCENYKFGMENSTSFHTGGDRSRDKERQKSTELGPAAWPGG